MRASISTTAKKIWRMMQSKARRDAHVAAHISNTVASQILILREAKGWTQKQLAEKCGMRQSRISALEDPNYENFEAATLRRLASAFDVALTIRFIPFSELTGWTARLSFAEVTPPPDFSHDRLPSETGADGTSNPPIENSWSTTNPIVRPEFGWPAKHGGGRPEVIEPGMNALQNAKVITVSNTSTRFGGITPVRPIINEAA